MVPPNVSSPIVLIKFDCTSNKFHPMIISLIVKRELRWKMRFHQSLNCVQLRIMPDLEQTKTGKSLSNDKYLNLLFSAATPYDNQFESKKSNRKVFMKSIADYDDHSHSPNDLTYDIDAPVSTILANSMERQNKT